MYHHSPAFRPRFLIVNEMSSILMLEIYFQSLFSAVTPGQHPIVILKDVSYDDLDSVVQFMYNGIVNVSSDKLPAVLKVRTHISNTL